MSKAGEFRRRREQIPLEEAEKEGCQHRTEVEYHIDDDGGQDEQIRYQVKAKSRTRCAYLCPSRASERLRQAYASFRVAKCATTIR